MATKIDKSIESLNNNKIDWTDKSSDMLINIGKHCSYEYCRTLDFLPFECKFCKDVHCLEHRIPHKHECTKYKDNNHKLKIDRKITYKYVRCYNSKCTNLVENTLLNLIIATCKICENVRCSTCRIYHKHK